MSIKERLLAEVRERETEWLELVEELIRFETPSPPARNTEEIQNYVAGQLRAAGCSIDEWELYPGDKVVVGTKRGTRSESARRLILNGHVDVAQVEEDEPWVRPPFDPVTEDGYVYGRGASDMKGGVAGMLFAMKLLQEHGIELPGDVYVQSVTGEEVGEAGTKSCCERGYEADFALVTDSSDLQIQGQGGVVTGWVTVKSKETFHDAQRRQMIHAGGGVHGASAVEKMAKVVQSLQELEQHWSVMKSYPGFPHGTTTINPAVIEGGRHAAFIADECHLWITVHYYPNEHHDEVVREIEDYLNALAAADPWLRDNPLQFKWGGESMIEDRGEVFPPLAIDEEWPGVQVLERAHAAVHGESAVKSMSQTVTDGGWFSDAGIPSVIYGPGNLENAHAVNERVSVDQLRRYIETLVCFLLDWGEVE
ncbi:acetylornithine deacetylase [Salsuginibacillus kocurii]|uniref:acetylornithine deacetylase n=1 Tax=Salsuginibacillus kocurii TaxID=427078 RepID=UPI00036DA2BC